jgi:polar amino acid transport system ATP-binding protein
MIKTIDVCKNFGTLEVLKIVSLNVEQKEVVCIIGPSGAGKSTYLRSLNRLEKITSGQIYIEDKLLFDCEHGVNKIKMHAKERAESLLEVGMVFQRFNLFPHKTVLENVMISPVNVKKINSTEAKHKA